jgi:hypothetical protein
MVGFLLLGLPHYTQSTQELANNPNLLEIYGHEMALISTDWRFMIVSPKLIMIV